MRKRGTTYMAQNPNEELEQEEMTVTLTLDDGSELECVVLTIFESGGEKRLSEMGAQRGAARLP